MPGKILYNTQISYASISWEKIGRAILIVYLIGLIFFARNFTVISMGPVFITDIALFLLAIASLASIINKGRISKIPFGLHLLFLLSFAAFELSRGYFLYDDLKMSLRQFAPFLYSLSIIFIYYLFTKLEQIVYLLKIFFYAATITVALAILKIPVGHYSAWGVAFFIGFFLHHMANSNKEKNIINAGMLLLIFGLFASTTARGSWIALFFSAMLSALLLNLFVSKLTNTKVKKLIITGITTITLIITAGILNPALNERISSIFTSHQAISNQEGDNLAEQNAVWRYLVWKDMLSDYMQKPIIGYGFGNKFIPTTIQALGWGLGDSDFLDPHNSHIHILYMMGIIGLLLFELYFIRIFIRYIRIMNTKELFTVAQKTFFISMLASILYILLLSNFEVVLESPYMIMYLWIIVGLLFAGHKYFMQKHEYKHIS